MCSTKKLCRPSHRRYIQFFFYLNGIPSLKYMRNCRIYYLITVGFPLCIQPAVKTFFHFTDVNDCYILRQIKVHIFHDLRRRFLCITVKIGYLCPGMHSCIGSAGSLHRYFFTSHFGQKSFQLTLNRISCGILLLPALISGSFILQDNFEITQSILPPRDFPFLLQNMCIP